jgi:hypothetical protein
MIAAKTALEARVAATRAEAPAELAAWADAHDAYVAAFLDDCAARGEPGGTTASVATRERAGWAEVRAGTRVFVDEDLYYVTMNADPIAACSGSIHRLAKPCAEPGFPP